MLYFLKGVTVISSAHTLEKQVNLPAVTELLSVPNLGSLKLAGVSLILQHSLQCRTTLRSRIHYILDLGVHYAQTCL